MTQGKAMQTQRVFYRVDTARKNYNRLSRWYDLISGSTEKKYRQAGLEKLNVQPGEQVLEIGFGTGHCIQVIAQAVGDEGRVVGIDISDGMIKVTQQRITRADLDRRVELYNADAIQLPFKADTFDAIFMSFTLELFDTPDITLVLQQCWQILRPGGRLCTVNLTKKAQPTLAVRIYEWFHKIMPGIVDCRPISATTALKQAAFHISSVTEMSLWGLPVEIILAHKSIEKEVD